MNTEERLSLITRNLQEVIGEGELRNKLDSGKEFSVYWGTATTGSISIAYFFPMLKVADFLNAGCKVKILIADLHGALDGISWEELESKENYYKEAILTILKTINVPVKNLEFVRGSELQLNPEYQKDLLKLSTMTSLHDSTKAASEVVKNIENKNPKLSGLLYPLMQALDEEYLKVDAQFGGVDQRKIMVYAREYLPKVGYEKRIELMNPIIRGLVGEKMSSSTVNSKIDLMDDEAAVKKRINKADCVAGDPDNGVMAILKYLIFTVKDKFTIERPEKFGGNLEYNSYDAVEKDFKEKTLHPLDLKNGVAKEINEFLSNFRDNAKLRELHDKAYS